MKKALCVAVLLVLCLFLTGCAETKVDMTGEWYMLQKLEKYGEPIDRRPERLEDLPEELQDIPEETSVTFRKVHSRTTVVEMTYEDQTLLVFVHREDDGNWSLYVYDSYCDITTFGDGEGSFYRIGRESDVTEFTYTVSEDELSLCNGETTVQGPIERWTDNICFWENTYRWGVEYEVFVRRESVLNDDLRLR